MEIRPIFHQLTSNIICHMLFGTCCEKSNGIFRNDFFTSTLEILKIMNTFNISDLIPLLKSFDLQCIERHMKCANNRMESCFSRILKEYRNGNEVVGNSSILKHDKFC